MSAYDGGPAFPIAPHSEDDGVTMISRPGHPGMSLRDWFAGQALAGVLASYSAYQGLPPDEKAAAYACDYADAMMAERERRYGKQEQPEAEVEGAAS